MDNSLGKRKTIKRKSDSFVEYERQLKDSLHGKYLLLFFFEDGQSMVLPLLYDGLEGDVLERSRLKVSNDAFSPKQLKPVAIAFDPSRRTI